MKPASLPTSSPSSNTSASLPLTLSSALPNSRSQKAGPGNISTVNLNAGGCVVSEFQRPWQVRTCPIDFADTFIREGWRGVEAKYGFHTRINKRCIAEAGGEDLIRKRRAYLAQVRLLRKSIQHRHETVEPVQIVPQDVQAAIAWLRSREGGAWLITAAGAGDFYFGATRKTGMELIERAARKGWTGA